MDSSSSPVTSISDKVEGAQELPERYLILETLGEGAFGKVVKCYDKTTLRTVAIKTNKWKETTAREVCYCC